MKATAQNIFVGTKLTSKRNCSDLFPENAVFVVIEENTGYIKLRNLSNGLELDVDCTFYGDFDIYEDCVDNAEEIPAVKEFHTQADVRSALKKMPVDGFIDFAEAVGADLSKLVQYIKAGSTGVPSKNIVYYIDSRSSNSPKINAILLIRANTGLTLREAEDLVDSKVLDSAGVYGPFDQELHSTNDIPKTHVYKETVAKSTS